MRGLVIALVLASCLAGCGTAQHVRTVVMPSGRCSMDCFFPDDECLPIAGRTVSDWRSPKLSLPPLSYEFYLLPDRTLIWRPVGSADLMYREVSASDAERIYGAILELSKLADCVSAGTSFCTMFVRVDGGFLRARRTVTDPEDWGDSVPPEWNDRLRQWRAKEEILRSMLVGGGSILIDPVSCDVHGFPRSLVYP